ncbi:LacI family DNA-binding transcriptional regulator [Sphaerisporangium sp. TRM90804]|nr:LacI family DNA-binding transcriptional regulator [Sphaerisporangium sp. TRM90804]MDH2429702.1 LacI family DNA-binding transcriptional regulator [Sphaerisporangium sp. TRM90804]
MQAVSELGYVPNSAARSLVTDRTDTVALVVLGADGRGGDDPLFSAVVRAAGSALEDSGKHVTLMLAGSSAHARMRVEQYVAGGHVDGVVLVSVRGGDHLPAALARTGVPIVSVGRSALPFVDGENTAGAALAVRHLLAKGRRRIGMIGGPVDSLAAQDRMEGYRDTVRDAGRRSMIALGDYTRASGAEAMRRLLDDDPELDAVFAAGDLMAIGALHTLRESGRRVPDDVAVVGFGDVEAAAYTVPPLTTVRSSGTDHALAAVRLLLRQIDGGPVSSIILPTELVVRSST